MSYKRFGCFQFHWGTKKLNQMSLTFLTLGLLNSITTRVKGWLFHWGWGGRPFPNAAECYPQPSLEPTHTPGSGPITPLQSFSRHCRISSEGQNPYSATEKQCFLAKFHDDGLILSFPILSINQLAILGILSVIFPLGSFQILIL